MKSDETKDNFRHIVVYFGHSEDHAETDSGWELRKHETNEDSVESKNIEVVETTLTSKIRPGTALHASTNEFSGRRTLFPQSTDAEIEALLDCFLPDKGDGTLSARSTKRTRTISELMHKLVRPIEQSESTRNEGSASSTTTSALLISPAVIKTVSKD